MTHRVSICGINTNDLPKLKPAEQDEMMQKIKKGDKEAEEYFILCNMRLVLSCVQRFRNKGNSDDLFQAGCVGLIKAVDNFDTSYNVKFSTYAVPMILGEIRRLIREENMIRVSRRLRDTAYLALSKKEELEKISQTSPSIMEIANELDMDEREVASALDAVSEPISLYAPCFNDGEEKFVLLEQLYDTNYSEDKWLEDLDLKNAFHALSKREHEIINLRYYVGRTQTEISDELGISQAQVSRLEKNAITKMRNML